MRPARYANSFHKTVCKIHTYFVCSKPSAALPGHHVTVCCAAATVSACNCSCVGSLYLPQKTMMKLARRERVLCNSTLLETVPCTSVKLRQYFHTHTHTCTHTHTTLTLYKHIAFALHARPHVPHFPYRHLLLAQPHRYTLVCPTSLHVPVEHCCVKPCAGQVLPLELDRAAPRSSPDTVKKDALTAAGPTIRSRPLVINPLDTSHASFPLSVVCRTGLQTWLGNHHGRIWCTLNHSPAILLHRHNLYTYIYI